MFFNKNKDVIKLNYETIGTNEFNIKDIESLVIIKYLITIGNSIS